MIVKIHKPGKSFKGVICYLSHDSGNAQSSERVGWTHTLNLANDHVPSAVDEMLWTCRSADQLKRAAGVSTGGSKLERPVKHFSLNWHPSETPNREDMIEATKRYLQHMGMEDRQAILFSHTDKSHAHVHIVVNVVSPQDGRALQMPFEYRRTQSWAKAYEHERGRVFCEERLKNESERQKSPPRHLHEAFKPAEAAFEYEESKRRNRTPDFFERGDTTGMNAKEWEALKGFQKEQRQKHFADGKYEFKELRKQVYREVRQEFRGQWNAYYSARRSGGNPVQLACIKSGLLQAQQKVVAERRDTACEKLRETRDNDYQLILEQQKVDRAALRLQQSRGLRTHSIFETIYPSQVAHPARDRETPSGLRPANTVQQRHESERRFERSTAIVTDPVHINERREPAVVRTDGRDALRRAAPEITTGEMTELRIERQQARNAREMTDQAREQESREVSLIQRTSWNRLRRYRSRGD